MPYAFTLDVPADDSLYAEIRAELPDTPPPGLVLHLVVPGERGLRYIDVWEDKASWEQARDAERHHHDRHPHDAGLPHDDSLIKFEELDAIDVWR